MTEHEPLAEAVEAAERAYRESRGAMDWAVVMALKSLSSSPGGRAVLREMAGLYGEFQAEAFRAQDHEREDQEAGWELVLRATYKNQQPTPPASPADGDLWAKGEPGGRTKALYKFNAPRSEWWLIGGAE